MKRNKNFPKRGWPCNEPAFQKLFRANAQELPTIPELDTALLRQHLWWGETVSLLKSAPQRSDLLVLFALQNRVLKEEIEFLDYHSDVEPFCPSPAIQKQLDEDFNKLLSVAERWTKRHAKEKHRDATPLFPEVSKLNAFVWSKPMTVDDYICATATNRRTVQPFLAKLKDAVDNPNRNKNEPARYNFETNLKVLQQWLGYWLPAKVRDSKKAKVLAHGFALAVRGAAAQFDEPAVVVRKLRKALARFLKPVPGFNIF